MADAKCPDCPWESTGWETKKAAQARLSQHKTEHESGEPMPELADFIAEGNR